MELQGSDKVTFRGSGKRLITVIAVFLSVIGLIVLNATVLNYFFGNLSRTSTHHLLNKTEMYDLELMMNVTIDEVAKDAERLVNQRGFDLDREIQGKFSAFNGLLDDLKTEFDSVIGGLKETIANQDLGELKEQFSKLQEGVEEFDVNKPTLNMLFKLDVTEFLGREHTGKEWRSEFFFCRGLPWSLTYTDINTGEHLSVYLRPHHREETRWEIKTKFKVTLLNQEGKDDIVSEERSSKFDNDSIGFGFPTLILKSRLVNGGFVKENKIDLKLELVAEELVGSDLQAED